MQTLTPFTQTGSNGSPESWQLVWHDEFEGVQGAAPDPAKWEHERGGEGWGNHELQFYTGQTDNAALDGNSCLVITAHEVPAAEQAKRTCWYGSCRFTSARLVTYQKFSFTYGLVEARLKIPFGQGMWPALWMLGDNFPEIGWPACGEIDIMENIGREPGIVHGTVHGPGYSGGDGIGGTHVLPPGQMLRDEFHVVAVDWQSTGIRWYFDNQQFFELLPEHIPAGTVWPFNQPFFILLNVAVGGDWPGSPDTTTTFPQMMLIDFIRVFQRI